MLQWLVLTLHNCHITSKDVHCGTFRGSRIFRNLYFKSRISDPILESLVRSKMSWLCRGSESRSVITWLSSVPCRFYLNKSWWCLHRRQNIYSIRSWSVWFFAEKGSLTIGQEIPAVGAFPLRSTSIEKL